MSIDAMSPEQERRRPRIGGPARRSATPFHEESSAARQLERDLRTAIHQETLTLHYQPRLTLAAGVTVSAEALVRWPHRRHGLITPSGFVPLAEKIGMICELGGWAMLAACRDAMMWRGTPEPISVSVNVSGRQLRDALLIRQVAAALDRSGLPPERLEIELSESAVSDLDIDTLLLLSSIRDLGVGIALDDFGSGFASLSILRRLPLTVMKLDRSLVRDLPGNREDAAIVRAVVETGHALDLTVTAEGVETEAQRAYLSGIGCDEAQGYLFSPPLTAAAIGDTIGQLRASNRPALSKQGAPGQQLTRR